MPPSLCKDSLLADFSMIFDKDDDDFFKGFEGGESCVKSITGIEDVDDGVDVDFNVDFFVGFSGVLVEVGGFESKKKVIICYFGEIGMDGLELKGLESWKDILGEFIALVLLVVLVIFVLAGFLERRVDGDGPTKEMLKIKVEITVRKNNNNALSIGIDVEKNGNAHNLNSFMNNQMEKAVDKEVVPPLTPRSIHHSSPS